MVLLTSRRLPIPIASRARVSFDRMLASLQAVPGFESVTASGDVPLAGGDSTLYARADREVPPIPKRNGAPSHDIGPNYLKPGKFHLLPGAPSTNMTWRGGQPVVLISQAGASKVFPGENPIGKTLLVTSLSVPCEIIGIVGDVRSNQLNKANDMEFYRPWTQENFPFVALTVRSRLPLETITKLVQGCVNQVDPGIAIAFPQMMDTIVSQALGQARLMTILLGTFAGVALLLATVGIYGAVAYTVKQRTGEIGVRMALGAQTADVLRLVIGQGMKPVVIGLAVGLTAAIALGRLISTQLYQVSPHNPALLLGTTIILALAALLACLFPARRASLLNPVIALRTE